MAEQPAKQWPEATGYAQSTPTEALGNYLELVRDSSIAHVPDLTGGLQHNGRIPLYAPHTLHGTYMAENMLQPFVENGEAAPNELAFTPQPLLGMGRETSWRKVFFGRLDMQSRSGEVSDEVQVAVKPFPASELNYAFQEAAMLQYLRQKGIATLELVALIVDNQGEIPAAYVVTRFEPGFAPLNDYDWKNLNAEELPHHFDTALTTLTTLHSNMIFHGDAEFKNLANGEVEGSVVAFDLERSVSMADTSPGVDVITEVELKRLTQTMSRDFTDLNTSLQEFVYPNLPDEIRPRTEKEKFDFAFTNIYEAYIHKLHKEHADTPYLGVLTLAFERMLEQKRNEAIQ